MSNIFHSDNVDSDFANFEIAIKKTNLFRHSFESNQRPTLKRYHRLAYAIALIQNKLEQKWKEPNKFLFLNEILSDLLSNLSISYIGFYHSSLILVRRQIENFYNHIYYFEHPVEYELLNLGRNEYTPIIELKEYLENHPIIKPLQDKNVKIHNDTIFQNYQELCRTAHTKGEDFMGLAKNLEEIKPEFEIQKHLDWINGVILRMIYLLYKFHQDIIFSNTELDIISRSFPKNKRNELLS